MSRYINADTLRHKVLYFADARNLNGNHEQAKAYNHCLCMIDEQKTADVVEVVHGKWKRVIADFSDGSHCYVYECECGMRMFERWNFCPNCGADMRGGHNERE